MLHGYPRVLLSVTDLHDSGNRPRRLDALFGSYRELLIPTVRGCFGAFKFCFVFLHSPAVNFSGESFLASSTAQLFHSSVPCQAFKYLLSDLAILVAMGKLGKLRTRKEERILRE